MKLYDRDYCSLTKQEQLTWNEIKKQEEESVDGISGLSITRTLHIDYPKAVRHFLELFPNHYLDTEELQERATLKRKTSAFEALLDTDGVGEREILNHIRDQRSFFIIGSILKNYASFGHHAAFLFPEFPLGTTHKADFLLIGQNSQGYHFLFVEFEAPRGRIARKNGRLGEVCRKGLEQAEDWGRWLERNYGSLQESFEKYKKPGETLPDEFTRLDLTRLHYVVVAGRRTDFQAETYRTARELTGNRRLLHYDNLADCARAVIGQTTY